MILQNLYKLPSAYYSLYGDVRRQRRFVRDIMERDIENAQKSNDGTLDEEDFDKIRNYYGFGVPAIVGEGICTLRGIPMNARERLASTYQGALTGLYDDFFDKTHLGQDEIRQMMNTPTEFKSSSSLEKLFIHFMIKVHENLADKDLFNECFDQVFKAQIESKKQASEDLSRESIKEITFKKGGNSVLFYRSVFENQFQPGEEEALFHIGALMQLGNDIFDVYKDEKAQIHTLLTTCGTIEEVRQVFLEQMAHSILLIKDTAYDKLSIQNYLNKFVLGISRCFVCLDQLEGLEKKTGGRFSPAEYTREELICDMEKPWNMMRSLRYFTNYTF